MTHVASLGRTLDTVPRHLGGAARPRLRGRASCCQNVAHAGRGTGPAIGRDCPADQWEELGAFEREAWRVRACPNVGIVRVRGRLLEGATGDLVPDAAGAMAQTARIACGSEVLVRAKPGAEQSMSRGLNAGVRRAWRHEPGATRVVLDGRRHPARAGRFVALALGEPSVASEEDAHLSDLLHGIHVRARLLGGRSLAVSSDEEVREHGLG